MVQFIIIKLDWLSNDIGKMKDLTSLVPTHLSRITSIRLLIATTELHKLEIHQMDVKMAFLNGELEDEIYIV